MCAYRMCENVVVAVILLNVIQVCLLQEILRTPPRVETNVMLLDSFVPASMQVIAHLTELMKYDLRPPTTTPSYGPTMTSTVRPTPSHRPGIYAPQKPPGPETYYSALKDFSHQDYIERLRRPSGPNYFDIYKFGVVEEHTPDIQPVSSDLQPRNLKFEPRRQQAITSQDITKHFGKNFANIFELALKVEPYIVPNDVDAQVQEFSKDYDDSDFRHELVKKKQVPPTRAYVTLLSLYDLLGKESKRLGLNKFQGYNPRILRILVETSSGTSANQLRTVLSKSLEEGDIKAPEVVKKMSQVITDLDEDGSYLNIALKYVPPLSFVL